MTDIVTRLRDGVFGLRRISLCGEAAYEMERMRLGRPGLTCSGK